MRINRFLAQAGFGSRRHVEELVRQGRVCLNRRTITALAVQVDPATDVVEVDGQRVRAAVTGRVLMLHKPEGVVCSFRRQGSHPCLADALPAGTRQGRLLHVGRLDCDSSGLLLLTDDGALAHRLLHPSHPVWKEYEVELDAPLAAPDLARLRHGGVSLDRSPCAPARVQRLPDGNAGPRYRFCLREGRNRQIRRMALAVGRAVLSLRRTAFGPVRLGTLPPGALRALTPEERTALERAADQPATGPRRDSTE